MRVRLELTRSTLRDWRRSDAAALARHADNRHIWRNLRDAFPHPYAARHARRFIAASLASTPRTHFAIEVAGEAAGGIGLRLQQDIERRSAEIGFWLGETFWGRGITTEAVGAFTSWSFRAFDLSRIYACVFEWNPASMRVLEKAGYAREARLRKAFTKDGRTIDGVLYAAVRD